MLYPHKIRILKLTDAGFHVLIPAPAILDRIESLILSLGRHRYLKEFLLHGLPQFFTCYVCGLESVS